MKALSEKQPGLRAVLMVSLFTACNSESLEFQRRTSHDRIQEVVPLSQPPSQVPAFKSEEEEIVIPLEAMEMQEEESINPTPNPFTPRCQQNYYPFVQCA